MEEYNMMKYQRFKDEKSTLTVYGTRLELRKPWSDCERQLCSCSKPDAPSFRYQCENGGGCGNFNRMDFGCYRLAVGKEPVKVCEDSCSCVCHPKVEEEKE
jgi:hypothetical protein